MLLSDGQEWRQQANCRGLDPELFHPDRGSREYKHAIAVCSGCQVREECLAYALTAPEALGIWGGMSERQRRNLRRRRRATA